MNSSFFEILIFNFNISKYIYIQCTKMNTFIFFGLIFDYHMNIFFLKCMLNTFHVQVSKINEDTLYPHLYPSVHPQLLVHSCNCSLITRYYYIYILLILFYILSLFFKIRLESGILYAPRRVDFPNLFLYNKEQKHEILINSIIIFFLFVFTYYYNLQICKYVIINCDNIINK